MSELLSLVALVVAAMLGFAWMGEGGAVVFALLGLWGCHGAARPWRLGRHGIGLLTVLATLFPAALWLIGALRPDFAQAVLDAFPQMFERALGLTMADGRAAQTLARAGHPEGLAAIRLGVGACWLCALPTAAAIVLWSDVRPSARRWARDGVVAVLLLVSALLTSGIGFGPGGGSLALGGGILLYPALFGVWLCALAILRAWAGRWLRPVAAPPAGTP